MPLAVIAASFFLPTLKTCNTIESPMEVAADGMVWVVPWYLAALILAVVTGIAVLRGRAPGRASWISGFVSVVASGLVAFAGFAMFTAQIPDKGEDGLVWFAIALLIVSLVVGIHSLVRARTQDGWPAWTRMLLAYWAFVLPLVGLFVLEVFDGSTASIDGLGIGAHLVVLSVVTLGMVLRVKGGEDRAAP